MLSTNKRDKQERNSERERKINREIRISAIEMGRRRTGNTMGSKLQIWWHEMGTGEEMDVEHCLTESQS